MHTFAHKKGDDALILALAAGQSVTGAARKAGISRRTAYTRMAEPDFRQRVFEARGVMMAQALGILADSGAQAATAMRKLLRSKNENVVLGASRSLLEFLMKLRSTNDLEERIAALEARANRNQKPCLNAG